MPREIRDQNTNWTLAQAYAGLEELHSARKDVAHQNGLVWVTATPDGGAQSVRLHVREDWEETLSDDDLLAEITEKQSEGGS